MKKMIVVVAFAACAAFVTSSVAQDKAEVKCPVSNRAIDKEHSVKHNGGVVYFCCPNCPKAFEKNTEKFSAKANMQLITTGQAKQVKCVFTGGKLNPDTKITVQGVAVCFCCVNCQGKATDKSAAEQPNFLFNDKAFKKGFEVKKGN
jgi:YHS domain-containing protein